MNIKTFVLICFIVLFVPAVILADNTFSGAASAAVNRPVVTKTDLQLYKQRLQQKFEEIAHQKDNLEQELLNIHTIEQQQQEEAMSYFGYPTEMSDAEAIDKCKACRSGVNAIVKSFGCGSFAVSYKSCIPFIETVVGAAVCAGLVFTAKKTIVSACEPYSDINKVASLANQKVCEDITHLC